jgi:gamma-glutamylcyclotransferase (GGCT)/AIG2-like uncharacterized protein YtfP
VDRLFTYGTLRPSLYPVRMGQMPSTKATLCGFKMYNLGKFPCLIHTRDLNVSRIVGEVIELDNIKRYDPYEGYPHLYDREEVNAKTEGGKEWLKCWVYFMRPSSFDRANGAVWVPSGDWANVLTGTIEAEETR